MEKINAALKELLVKEHPEFEKIFKQYPAYSPLGRANPFPFGPPAPGDPSPTNNSYQQVGAISLLTPTAYRRIMPPVLPAA